MVMGAFAEFERALIRARQPEGIAVARQRGAYRGRNRSSPMKSSQNCIAASPPASARQPSLATWGSAAKPYISICAELSDAFGPFMSVKSLSAVQTLR
jgi:hypothetical protein